MGSNRMKKMQVPLHQIFQFLRELQIILVQIFVQLVGTQNLGDFHKLVQVVTATEKGLLPENHAGQHATQGPDVQGIIVPVFIRISVKIPEVDEFAFENEECEEAK